MFVRDVLLRRSQSVARKLDLEPDDAPPAEVARPSPRLERRNLSAWRDDPEQSASPPAEPAAAAAESQPAPYDGVDRRSGQPDVRGARVERRSIDSLRTEYQRTLVSNPSEVLNPTQRRSFFDVIRTLKPSRIILLVVALGAGGTAAYLALQHDQPAPVVEAPAPPKVLEAPKTQVLVAKQTIGIGARITADELQWQDWPLDTVQPQYITVAATPDAIATMTGEIARGQIYVGEPIRAEKLVHTGQGDLSAILGDGLRGVSVPVNAESASGGFIAPDDHVDVVLTRNTDAVHTSATILRNVRVLAINARLVGTGADGTAATADQPSTGPAFTDKGIATLELNPTQAEIIIGASSQGSLSLMLRSVSNAAQADTATLSPADQAIRLSSPFWTK